MKALTAVSLWPLCALAAPEPQPAPASPYFIVGVRCEGIEARTPLPPFQTHEATVEAAVRRSANDDACKQLFSVYGVEPYQWKSPEELEQLNLRIQTAGDFKESHLSAARAQEPGHAVLTLKVTPRDRFHLQADAQAHVFSGGALSQHSTITATDRSLSPLSLVSYGVTTEYRKAPSPFFLDHDSPRPFRLVDKVQKEMWSVQPFVSHSFPVTSRWNASWRYQLSVDNDGAIDNRFARQFVFHEVRADLLREEALFALDGTLVFGPALIYSTGRIPEFWRTSAGIEAVTLRTRENALPGIRLGYRQGQEHFSYFRLDISTHTSVDRKSRYMEYSTRAQKHFEEWGNTLWLVGAEGHSARNCTLPTERIPTESPSLSRMFLGTGLNFEGGEAQHQVMLLVGNHVEEERFASHSSHHFRRSSVFSSLNYRYLGENLGVNLSAGYSPTRLF